ncbi:MAG: NAD-dependent epimerase/dehydratase family protein [Desulfobacterales bacterium]|nr:NAD-dependent epimerase/dehydratase family protein [Desulfobacterales bacterium]
MKTIAITGICGTHGGVLTERLRGKYKIIGIDHKAWTGPKPDHVTFVQGNLRRRVFTNVLSQNPIDAVVHLSITKHFNMPLTTIHELNVMRAQRIIEGCIKYNIKKVILLSEHTVYGALPNTPMWLKENAPLNGSRYFKEYASSITADLMFTELFWKAPELETVILRPVNVLGPKTRGLINSYLKLNTAPIIFGFDPMMQVIHEQDVSHAIELALQEGVKGIFNVVGPGALPLSVLAKESGLKQIPLPLPLASMMVNYLFKMRKFPFPETALSLLQYTLCIDGTDFKNKAGFYPLMNLEETINSLTNK